MELMTELYSALSTDSAIISHLAEGAGGVWADLTDYSGRRPVIAYSVISDVPILSGDDAEYQSAVTMRIHIVVDTGSDYGKIYAVTNPLMLGLGYMRYQCNEIIDDGHIVYVTDYKIGVDA